MRSDPALVLVLSIVFLGEKVSLLGFSGIVLVIFGVYLINMERFSVKEGLAPFRSLFRDRAIQFAVLTVFCVAAYSLKRVKIGVSP